MNLDQGSPAHSSIRCAQMNAGLPAYAPFSSVLTLGCTWRLLRKLLTIRFPLNKPAIFDTLREIDDDDEAAAGKADASMSWSGVRRPP